MRRLLIVACGATKRVEVYNLPAIDRYNGPPFKTLRKVLAGLPQEQCPTILILSAEFGLIAADMLIPNYDHRMTKARALALRAQVREALARALAGGRYDETMINLGADYLPALPLGPTTTDHLGTVTYAQGGIGDRMGHMKRWMLQT